MGAQTFTTHATGKTALDAFRSAVSEALYMRGHGGYTGSIAEKHGFTQIRDSLESLLPKVATCPHLSEEGRTIYAKHITDHAGATARDKAEAIAHVLIGIDDKRIADKWGPAGCIEIAPLEFLFFGWASS